MRALDSLLGRFQPTSEGLLGEGLLENIDLQGLSVLLTPLGGTPEQKSLRIDYDGYDEPVLGLPVALVCLGFLAPTVIAPGQIVRLDYDFEHSRITLFGENRDGNALERPGPGAGAEWPSSGHGSSSDGCVSDSIVSSGELVVKAGSPSNGEAA
jgi:hypothetical protein